ncbi:MAG: MYXO-CTERM sorting domain-containing protein [Polyangiales bacterium]
MTNAGGARVTRGGLDFLASNVPALAQKLLGGSTTGGLLTFPIGTSSGSISIVITSISYTICPDGPNPTGTPPTCTIEINIANISSVTIQSDTPDVLHIAATVPIRLQDLPITVLGSTPYVTLDDGSGGYVNLPITADVTLAGIPNDAAHAARVGYTSIAISNLAFDQTTVSNAISFHGTGIGSDILAGILNAVKGTVASSLLGGLSSKLAGPLQSATCMKEAKMPDGTMACPTGTFDVSGTCRFTNDAAGECVPMLLGTEMRLNLSSLLASISPGTTGGLDFGLAGGGDMIPAPGTDKTTNGMTLGLFGGAIPQPLATCIKPVDNPLTTGLTLPVELNPTTVDTAPTWWPKPGGTPDYGNGPDINIGVSQAFLNHAFTSAYNSGLLCLGINSTQFPSLPVGAIGALVHGLKQVTDQFGTGNPSTLALTIRPQKAPVIKLGAGDAAFKSPLIDITLPATAIDFYFWVEDRYVRLFTGNIDIGIGLNLEPGPAGITLKFPPSNPISFANVTVTNNTLLTDSDTDLAGVVGGIGSLIPASAFSSIKPFNLSSSLASLGLTLNIPPGGINTLPNGGMPYLGIFAKLGVAPKTASPKISPKARIDKMEIDAASYELKTFHQKPTLVHVHADAAEDNGSIAVEYSYQVDEGLWSSYFSGRDFVVDSPFFALEGKHTIRVSARQVGVVDSEGEPATLSVPIDVHPPLAKVTSQAGGAMVLQVADTVSHGQAIRVEASFDGAPYADVAASIEKPNERAIVAPTTAKIADLRITDESGNVTSQHVVLTPETIRGRPDPFLPSTGSCGCSVPGTSSDPTHGLAAFGALAAIGAVIERRRRRRSRVADAACATLFVASSGTMGCTCASGNSAGPPTGPVDSGQQETTPDIDAGPGLLTYVKGSYTSSAMAADGTIWVAGYHEGDPTAGSDGFFADLIVGKLDPTSGVVNWVCVDGVPSTAATYDPNGFRSGNGDPGDDVGMYTSMVLDAAGHPIVAYFDRTHGGLRVATYDGTTWASHEVEHAAVGWAGKYTAMTMVGGKPVIAYQKLEPGTGGFGLAKVRVAKASSATPAASTDWTIEDVASDPATACVQAICTAGQTCVMANAASSIKPICAKPITGCDASCSGTCIGDSTGKPFCATANSPQDGLLNMIGTSIAIGVTPASALAIAFYDRVHGNLRGGTESGGTWTITPATKPIDGWTGVAATDVGEGDRGLAVTMAIDTTGNWHLAYVDGVTESVLYKFVPGGDLTKASTAVVVDDGATSDGKTAFPDGLHVIGDNASISVDATGKVVVVYMDATGGTLHYAKATGGAKATFTHGVITQDGTAGFWPHLLGTRVVNFYRLLGTTAPDPTSGAPGDPVVLGDVRAVALP